MLRRSAFPVAASDDAALLAALRSRDERAYRVLVKRHHVALIALALTVVRERATAEEVVQDTWVAVLTGLDRFEGRASLSTWISAILINKARSRARRDGRVRPFSDLMSEGSADQGDSESFLADGHWAEPVALWDEIDPERIVAGRELWRHVVEGLDTLPPAQRAVVVLRDVQEVAPEDVCRLLGISEANGRLLLHRARVRLRRIVNDLVAIPPHAPVNPRSSGRA